MNFNKLRGGAARPAQALGSGNQRLQFLDSLRGVAAAYVVLYHLIYVGHVPAPKWLEGLASQGWTGVMLFFVVSCFSLFFTMPARLRETRPVLSFYLHRFFRIAPLFYAWLVVSVCLALRFNLPVTLSQVIESAFFVFNLVPGDQQGIVMASWTIGVEMLFYAIFPVIYFWTKNVIHAWSFVLGSLLLYFLMMFVTPLLPLDPITVGSIENWLFIRDLPIFAFGAVCFFLLADRIGKEPTDRERSLGLVLLLSSVIVMVAFANRWIDSAIFGSHPYVWPAIWYSLLLAGLALNPTIVFVNRVTRFLGEISYSLYLAHAPIISLLRHWYAHLLGHHWSPMKTFGIAAVATFIVVIPSAYLTYRLIELPFIRCGKQVTSHLSPRIKAGSMAVPTDL